MSRRRAQGKHRIRLEIGDMNKCRTLSSRRLKNRPASMPGIAMLSLQPSMPDLCSLDGTEDECALRDGWQSVYSRSLPLRRWYKWGWGISRCKFVRKGPFVGIRALEAKECWVSIALLRLRFREFYRCFFDRNCVRFSPLSVSWIVSAMTWWLVKGVSDADVNWNLWEGNLRPLVNSV